MADLTINGVEIEITNESVSSVASEHDLVEATTFVTESRWYKQQMSQRNMPLPLNEKLILESADEIVKKNDHQAVLIRAYWYIGRTFTRYQTHLSLPRYKLVYNIESERREFSIYFDDKSYVDFQNNVVVIEKKEKVVV